MNEQQQEPFIRMTTETLNRVIPAAVLTVARQGTAFIPISLVAPPLRELSEKTPENG